MTRGENSGRRPAWALIGGVARVLQAELHAASIGRYGLLPRRALLPVLREPSGRRLRRPAGVLDPLPRRVARALRRLGGLPDGAARSSAERASSLLTGLLARRFGGGPAAQGLAAVAAAVAPVWLGMTGYYSMNAFDILLLGARGERSRADPRGRRRGPLPPCGRQPLARARRRPRPRPPEQDQRPLARRRHLRRPRPDARASLARDARAVARGRPRVPRPPSVPRLERACTAGRRSSSCGARRPRSTFPPRRSRSRRTSSLLHPLAAPLWIAGLVWLLAARDGRRFRLLGVVPVATLGILLLNRTSKTEYLAASFAPLLSAGGVALRTGSSSRPARGAGGRVRRRPPRDRRRARAARDPAPPAGRVRRVREEARPRGPDDRAQRDGPAPAALRGPVRLARAGGRSRPRGRRPSPPRSGRRRASGRATTARRPRSRSTARRSASRPSSALTTPSGSGASRTRAGNTPLSGPILVIGGRRTTSSPCSGASRRPARTGAPARDALRERAPGLDLPRPEDLRREPARARPPLHLTPNVARKNVGPSRRSTPRSGFAARCSRTWKTVSTSSGRAAARDLLGRPDAPGFALASAASDLRLQREHGGRRLLARLDARLVVGVDVDERRVEADRALVERDEHARRVRGVDVGDRDA